MENYLEELKKKCQIDNFLFDVITDIFDKLIDFSYISKHQAKKLQKKLYQNINTVLIGNNLNIDYKSGYYDAVKKELYIKNIHQIESIYLRILYALTTTEIDKNTYAVGYSTSTLSTSDYKIRHENFGINRAVISNLACRLLYTIPTTLSIMPTYRTYENDFLGNKISSDNDIYFLEGKLLAQVCYVLDMSEEELYNNLFTSPKKFLNKFKAKISNHLDDNFLKIFDDISRSYSTYNKLVFFNKCLNDNYLNMKKKVLKSDIKDLKKEKEKIKLAIQNALQKLSPTYDEETELFECIEDSLAEEINNLEESILSNISKLQNILVDYIIAHKSEYSTISYAIKLKELDKILILKNEHLKESLFETISTELLNSSESTASNMIEKIKYSIVNEVISSDKYIKIYKNMKFKTLSNINTKKDSEVVALLVDDTFMQLIQIDHLNFTMKGLENNTHSIVLDNMGYLLNTPSIHKDLRVYEKLFTIVHTKFPKFRNVQIENMYLVNKDDISLLVILQNDEFSILKIEPKENESYQLKMVSLSEPYTLFNLRSNSLPMVYQKKENPFQRLFDLFFFV